MHVQVGFGGNNSGQNMPCCGVLRVAHGGMRGRSASTLLLEEAQQPDWRRKTLFPAINAGPVNSMHQLGI